MAFPFVHAWLEYRMVRIPLATASALDLTGAEVQLVGE